MTSTIISALCRSWSYWSQAAMCLCASWSRPCAALHSFWGASWDTGTVAGLLGCAGTRGARGARPSRRGLPALRGATGSCRRRRHWTYRAVENTRPLAWSLRHGG